MIDNKTIAVVVKAYNEESQIGMVINGMPDYVDRIVVVNDGSKDNTTGVVKEFIEGDKVRDNIVIENCRTTEMESTIYNKADQELLRMRESEDEYYPEHIVVNNNDTDRIVLIEQKNSGPGAAVAVGYKWAREHKIDCTIVIDGDGQMDPSEMINLVNPILYDGVDYTKGNRLSHPASEIIIPQVRYLGNNILSLLTKISSGYWGVSDTQTGYTGISLRALERLELHKIYHWYGYPNDILVKLNIINAIMEDVDIKPVYGVGEQSKMKVLKVIPKISKLLIKDFFWRLNRKYLINSFHPLFLLYWIGILLGVINIPVVIKIILDVLIEKGSVSVGWYITFLLLSLFSFQSLSFGMWMDMQDNASLEKKRR